MFIIDVTYTVPLQTVDAHLPAHIAFLKEQMAAGIFLASGRKTPREGGIILARGLSRPELDALLERDPFQIHKVADYRVTEVGLNNFAPGFEVLKD
ncbi:MAG: YciI family protein [Desulfovibrionaceae bacterium]